MYDNEPLYATTFARKEHNEVIAWDSDKFYLYTNNLLFLTVYMKAKLVKYSQKNLFYYLILSNGGKLIIYISLYLIKNVLYICKHMNREYKGGNKET